MPMLNRRAIMAGISATGTAFALGGCATTVPARNARAPTPFHLPRPSDYQMSAPGPAGARRIRRALLANGAPPNCKLLGVGPLAADFEDAEHRIADFQIVDARAQCSDRSGKVPAQHQRESRLRELVGAYPPLGTVDARRRDIGSM
jgi:hypothetical protein